MAINMILIVTTLGRSGRRTIRNAAHCKPTASEYVRIIA